MAPFRFIAASPTGSANLLLFKDTATETPATAAARRRYGHSFALSSTLRAIGLSWLRALAHVVLVVTVGTYALAQLAVFTPAYSEYIRGVIAGWWGLPSPDGHREMVSPTYFALFGALPMLASLLVAELLQQQQFRVRRVASTWTLRLAALLRRRPPVPLRCCSYGELLFLAVLTGGNACVFYYQCIVRLEHAPSPLPFEQLLKTVAVALGMNCMFNLAFLFLPATRNCAWMELLDISYANGIKYHRWLGVATVLTAVGHCAGFYWAWLLDGTWRDKCLPCFDCDLDAPRGRRVWLNVFGELALLCFVLIGATSIPWVRRKFYNAFYYTHQLFVVSVVFLVLHWLPSIWWLLPTFLLYVISRSLSSANSFTPVQVKEFTTLDNDIVKVVIARSAARDGDYKVGQFVYLNVPAISKLQWHAFTIGSSPRTNATTLTILLKSLGDWTNDLVEHSEQCKRDNVLPTIFMDGYYGASLEMYDEYPTVCMIGGGIGVTPLFAILEDMVAKLSYHESPTQRVFFVFTFRELALLEEIHPLLAELRSFDPLGEHFSFHLSLTRAPSADERKRCIRHTAPRDASASPMLRMPVPVRTRVFVQPLRASGGLKALMYVAVFACAPLALCYLEFRRASDVDDGDTPSLWPLRYFREAAVLLASALVVLLFVVTECALKAMAHKDDAVAAATVALESSVYETLLSDQAPPAFAATSALRAHTVDDLLSEYNVTVGQRPDMRAILRKVHRSHAYAAGFGAAAASRARGACDSIGVFVSGPEALKDAAARAVREIGASHFDVHEEAFEL